jgi:hypothetical protein
MSFGVDPDQDPAILVIELQGSNIKLGQFKNKVFLLITF